MREVSGCTCRKNRSERPRVQIGAWLQGALAELYATAFAQGVDEPGAAGGVYDNELFEAEGGERQLELPAVDLAVITHAGPD